MQVIGNLLRYMCAGTDINIMVMVVGLEATMYGKKFAVFFAITLSNLTVLVLQHTHAHPCSCLFCQSGDSYSCFKGDVV